MPLMILYGGELVFAFLFGRIALWMWRSREMVLRLWRARHGLLPVEPDPDDGTSLPRPVALASRRRVVRLRHAA
jgi:hypothetical protein